MRYNLHLNGILLKKELLFVWIEEQGEFPRVNLWLIYDEDTMLLQQPMKENLSIGVGLPSTVPMVHTSIKGDAVLITPDKPAWRNPASGDWEDQRIIGRDGRRFGPLPRSWVKYLGLFQNGDRSYYYCVGDREIHELPGYIEYGKGSVYTRTLHIGPGEDDLVSRLALEEKGLDFHLKAVIWHPFLKRMDLHVLKSNHPKIRSYLHLGSPCRIKPPSQAYYPNQ